jgi:YD repeat-containing protein
LDLDKPSIFLIPYMKYIRTAFTIIGTCIGLAAFPQPVEQAVLKQVSPLTPNAASLGKYGDIPVSLYTGIPNISIPLYQINVGSFTLPISLNYHAGGVQVDDAPSWVGMGWSLNAGGVLNCRMRGVTDYRMIKYKDANSSYIQTMLNPLTTKAEKNAAAVELQWNKYDTESDIFSISTGTLSHQFFLDVDGNAHGRPARKLKITPEGTKSLNQYNNDYFARWTVTDETGVKYIFGQTLADRDIPNDQYDGVEITRNDITCPAGSGNQEYINSWYLNQINLPTGESIYFTYESFSFCKENTVSQTQELDYKRRRSPESKMDTYYVQALRIKEIRFPTGKVVFDAGGQRRDILGDKVLDRIGIFSKRSGSYVEEKSFKLVTNNPANYTGTDNDESFRLALLSVTEFDKDGMPLSPYTFEYKNQSSAPNNFGLPARGSYSQDLWGYNNGKTGNSSLIPNYLKVEAGQIMLVLDGADRSVSPNDAQAGILKKITYPTKGTTEFFYESNVAKGITHQDESLSPPLDHDMREVTLYEGQNTAYSDPFVVYQTAGSANASWNKWSSPSAPAYFLDQVDLALEAKNSNGFFVLYSTLQSAPNTTLPVGEYRLKLTWTGTPPAAPSERFVRASISYEQFLAFVNPMKDLVAMNAAVTTNQSENLINGSLLNTNGSDVGYSDGFQIFKEGTTEVTVSSHMMYNGTPCKVNTPGGTGSFWECLTIQLEKKDPTSGQYAIYNNFVYFGRTYGLEKGDYRIKATWHDTSQMGTYAYVMLSWSGITAPLDLTPDENTEFTVGGLRIAKIVDTDGVTGQANTRWFDYSYDATDGSLVGSSGVIQNAPIHIYYTCVDRVADNSIPYMTIYFLHYSNVLTSYSNSPILQTSGGYVGYKKVTVYYGADKKGGKQVSYFTSAIDYPDGNLAGTRKWPQFNVPIEVDWRRGLNTKAIDMKYEDNTYTAVRESEKHFEILDQSYHPNNYRQKNVRLVTNPYDGLHYAGYETVSESFYMDESTERVKDSQSELVTTTTFEQNPLNLAVSKTTTTNSKGDVDQVVTKYPVDYNVENLGALKTGNFLSMPIKTETTKNGNLVSGVVVKYTDAGQPKEVYKYENSNLTPPPAHSGNIIVPAGYALKTEFSYDNNKKLTQSKQANNFPSAYIWGYGRSFPVVKIDNITSAEIPAPIVSAVESRVFAGGTRVSEFQADIDFLNTQVSSLRSNKNYSVTTYTYNTAFGITSQTDPNGFTTYYEYDASGRLQHIRDKDNNILKSFSYHYKGQNAPN